MDLKTEMHRVFPTQPVDRFVEIAAGIAEIPRLEIGTRLGSRSYRLQARYGDLGQLRVRTSGADNVRIRIDVDVRIDGRYGGHQVDIPGIVKAMHSKAKCIDQVVG